jgi:hypothetical protein
MIAMRPRTPATDSLSKRRQLDSVSVDCHHFGVHVQDCTESTTAPVHRIESDSSVDGMLGVDRRAQSLEIADRRPVHSAVRSNLRIHTAAEVRGEVSSTAGIHG